MSLLSELKRRNVIRAGLAWLALGWLLVAMSNLLFPALNLPISAVRWLIIGLGVAWVGVLWFAWRYEFTEGGLKRDRGPGGDSPINTRTAHRIDQVTVVLVLAALSLSLLQQFLAPYAREREAAQAAAVAAPAQSPPAPLPPVRTEPADPHSIAVLPFANLSPEANDAYFADGLAEELRNVLARIEGLKVISRSSSFVFRDPGTPSEEIGARLGVANLVEGSVRREGDTVRITVQLIDAGSDRHLWSNTYERQLKDIFQLQQDISQAIADALAATLGVRTVQVAPSTQDLQAYELYLRGRQLFVQRGANLPAARDLLEQAVARDPAFADAWSALAGTWYVWRSYAAEPKGIDTIEQSALAANRALALDPQHAGALAVSARLAAESGQRLGEFDLIARALALEPNNANTWLWKGLGEYEVGHIDAAHQSFVQAQRLDPLSGLNLGWLAITTAQRGDIAAARPMLRQAHTLGWRGPASRALFLLAREGGDDPTEPYLAWLHDDDSLPQAQRDFARGLAPALADPEQWGPMQQRLLAASAERPAREWAILLQIFGLTDAASESALRTDDANNQTLSLIQWMPAFDSFRAHPRFFELAEREGLPAYWRQHGPPDGCTLIESPPSLECRR
jgi:TolB-like protein